MLIQKLLPRIKRPEPMQFEYKGEMYEDASYKVALLA
jgi:hypothetical protein